jgi:hypothetical protein
MRSTLSLVALIVLLLPAASSAHPCEQDVAQAIQKLAYENQQIAALEVAGNGPAVQALRREHTYRMQLLQQLQTECAQSVRDERQGSTPARVAGGCAKDTDCKGDRICVEGPAAPRDRGFYFAGAGTCRSAAEFMQ